MWIDKLIPVHIVSGVSETKCILQKNSKQKVYMTAHDSTARFVRRSVGLSVGWSIGLLVRLTFTFFINFISLNHFKSF